MTIERRHSISIIEKKTPGVGVAKCLPWVLQSASVRSPSPCSPRSLLLQQAAQLRGCRGESDKGELDCRVPHRVGRGHLAEASSAGPLDGRRAMTGPQLPRGGCDSGPLLGKHRGRRCLSLHPSSAAYRTAHATESIHLSDPQFLHL